MTFQTDRLRVSHPLIRRFGLARQSTRWGKRPTSYLLGPVWAASPAWLRRLAVGKQQRLSLGQLSITVRW